MSGAQPERAASRVPFAVKALVISAVLVAGVTLLIASALTTVNKPSDAQVRAAVGAR